MSDRELRPLPYGKQSIDDEDVAEVVRVLRSDFLTQGPEVARFEAALCEATGARYAVAVANGTAALHLACLAAGVRDGDVGVVPTITFVASGNAVRYAGGSVAFADVDPDTALVTPASIEARVSELAAKGKRPKVIVPVDMTGAIADLAAVRAIADRVGAVVIEDAAHSLGARRLLDVGGRETEVRGASCQLAHMAILSFHPVKHVTTGEGGAVTTNDEALYKELCDLRTHGITKQGLEQSDGPWYYEQRVLGFNYRITDIQCALGTSQMRKLPAFIARRREVARRYDAAFAAHASVVRPLTVAAGSDSAYHLYVVRLVARDGEDEAGVAARRKALYLALAEQKIYTQVHYIPVHRQPDFRRAGMGHEHLPGASAYYASCLSLPMFPAMTDADVDRVVESVVRAAG
ncbi:MAG: UDP-4-amino-4,6-dideoxy-N-acetyl-beta-L-altrosamine transaminase [Myxococcales bacterium]|nr:UDP-4-amino-4,6-dideoxy-N-acetyl-beta-L-altrosamine transaminase [Myxococcales bacterium]